MYLLNDNQVISYVSNGQPGGYLFIEPFAQKMMQHTAYYFRLGPRVEMVDGEESTHLRLTAKDSVLTLEPGQYAVVTSLETFYLSNKVFGMFGQSSSFIRNGLELVHSPFLDPLFRGRLELGLGNRRQSPVSLKLGQRIGKVTFFDISDTYPIEMRKDSIVEKTFAKRMPMRDDDPVPKLSELDEEEWD